ncbi:MAG: ABC transporter permease [Chloroflexi bacterium]|nr:ABC transporter permease [Chloroflexota bacterium]
MIAPTPELRSGPGHEIRSLLRVTSNQLNQSMRYTNKFRLELIDHVFIVLPVILTAWAFSDGRDSARLESLTGLPDQLTFVILGFVAFSALGIGNMIMQDSHVAGGVWYEMITGTIERMFVLPIRRVTVILGIANYYLLLFTFHAITLFAGAWLLFGFDPEITMSGVLLGTYALVCLLALNLSIGIMGAALTLATKDAQTYLLVIHRPAAIVSGAYFLIEIIPQPFKSLAYANPIAYAVDAFRGALTDKPLLIDSLAVEFAVLTGIVIATGAAAAAIYIRMMRKMDREGTIGMF